MSAGDRDRDDELIAELETLLQRAARDTPPAGRPAEPAPREPRAPTPRGTPLQEYALELRDLCARVLEEADEATARAFWRFLLELAALHGRRAGGWGA